MSKKLRDRKINFRLATPLYDELEREAVAKGMPSLTALIRSILINHAAADADMAQAA